MNEVYQDVTFCIFLMYLFVIFLWVGFQAWRSVVHGLLRLFTGRTPKGRVTNAINAIFDVYVTQPGQKVIIVTTDGWEMTIVKKEGAAK
ncbi:hypothetical protein [Enterobacter mori]|uniref:hypothetical protein n=1 Tax=Enterobacter mori TaxID=539813 RepID=UPI003B83B16B